MDASKQRGHQQDTAVAILKSAPMHQRVQHKPRVSTRTCRFLPLISLPPSKPCGSMQPPFFGALYALAVETAAVGLASRSSCSRH